MRCIYLIALFNALLFVVLLLQEKSRAVPYIIAGRAYIEASVQFFKFTEGEEVNYNVAHQDGSSHPGHLH